MSTGPRSPSPDPEKKNKPLILVVDDQARIRESMALLLQMSGYEVRTAEHGFAALLQMRKMTPDLIISDLELPQIFGLEFLFVLRRYFPEIPVVAVSCAYRAGDQVPGGVIADAFYVRAHDNPEGFLRTIAELIQWPTALETSHPCQLAPV